MPLPEAQWSQENPGPPPEQYVPFKERVFKILARAIEKNKVVADKDKIGRKDKKRLAAEYREQAERIERG